MKRLTAVLLALMLLVSVFPAAALAYSTRTVYISRDDSDSRIYLRSGPGYGYGKKGVVYHNDEVKVLDWDDDWSRVRITYSKGSYEGYAGYIRTYYIDGTTKSLCTGKKTIKTKTRLYSSSNTSSSIRAILYKGEKVKVYSFDRDFARVTVCDTGERGWVPMYTLTGDWPDPEPEPPVYGDYRAYHTTASTLNVRSGPGTGYKKINSLSYGTKCYCLQTSGNWCKIRTFKSGITGWVSRTYLSSGASARVSTNGGRLHVRKGPSTSASVIGSLYNGASVTVGYVSGNWAYLKGGGLTGWSSMTYLKF